MAAYEIIKGKERVITNAEQRKAVLIGRYKEMAQATTASEWPQNCSLILQKRAKRLAQN